MTTVQADNNVGPAPPCDPDPDLSTTEKPVATPGLSAVEELQAQPFYAAPPSDDLLVESASPRSSAILLFLLCLVLHALLVIGCVVLVILHFTLRKGTITFSADRLNVVSGNIFYYVTASPNTVIKVGCLPHTNHRDGLSTNSITRSGLPCSHALCHPEARLQTQRARQADSHIHARQILCLAGSRCFYSRPLAVPHRFRPQKRRPSHQEK